MKIEIRKQDRQQIAVEIRNHCCDADTSSSKGFVEIWQTIHIIDLMRSILIGLCINFHRKTESYNEDQLNK
jgi:hypothetical protein